jgi:hypothetical protein
VTAESTHREGKAMILLRKTLALLVWIVIYVPTTLFVVLVMIKNYVSLRRKPERTRV